MNVAMSQCESHNATEYLESEKRMNRSHILKPLAAVLAGALCVASAHAAQSGQKAYEDGLQGLRSENRLLFNEECEQALQQSWGRFQGDVGEYRRLEQKYLNGASLAAVCAIKYGYIRYLWLGDVQSAHADPKFAKKPLDVRVAEATRLFGKRKVREFDEFLAKVNCNASTPRISMSDYFTQTVSVACSTPFGPATVDLSNLHVTVAGKDFWNGRDDTYYGRNFYRITGSRR
jgi:hypothetical protein